MKRSSLLLPLAAPVVVAALAGCGSSGNATAAAAAPSSTATAAANGPALALRSTSLGRVIVDAHGRTLYAFGHDLKNKSRCSGACASNWPPALSPAKPRVGAGISKAKLRVIKRFDGGRQLSFAGHPLYRYIADRKPGDVNGQGLDFFGGIWYVVSPAGQVVTQAPQSQSSTPSSGGGYSPGGY